MMKSIINTIVLILAIIAMLPGAAIPQEEPPASFTYPTDPALALITLRHLGGNTGVYTHQTVFADGLLLVEHMSHGEVVKSASTRLSTTEVDALLRLAIDGRLLSYDQASAKRDLEQTRKLLVSDGVTVHLEIHVPSLTRSDGTSGAASVELAIPNPTVLGQYFPELTEIAAVGELVSAIRAHAQAAATGGGS